MIIIQNIINLALLISFFSFLGLGVVSAKGFKNYSLLLPVFGYTAIIGLAYVISANLNISGMAAVGCGIILLTGSFILRIRQFLQPIKEKWQNGDFAFFCCILIVPLASLLLPALLVGFKHFFGYVNYDFFYNSQDSTFLQTHSVLQFGKTISTITPLTWSANYSGRIAISLLGSFFPHWISWDALQFNSLLLNTIVLLFSLSMATFCKEFFGMSKKLILVTVFFTVMSAGYAQSYCYYSLGQISVIPIFVTFCIFLNKLLQQPSPSQNKNVTVIILALLLNALFVMYAIMSFFAAGLMVLAFLVDRYKTSQKVTLNLLLKTCLAAFFFFCAIRLLIIPESINILKSWISLSGRVAGSVNNDLFVVFSEYLTEHFLSLLFGIANYPTTNSIFNEILPLSVSKGILLIGLGFGALLTTLWALIKFSRSSLTPKSNHSIITALFGITFISAVFFFLVSGTGYGIFKVQTWFIPLLTPLFIYFVWQPAPNKTQMILKLSCVLIVALNLITAVIYLRDYFAPETAKRFVNMPGITGSHDINDIAAQIKSRHITDVSLFLTNGLETAWIANLLRPVNLKKITHDLQPLQEKDFIVEDKALENNSWPKNTLIIMNNPNSALSDITSPWEGGEILYTNDHYILFDPSQLETLVYFGQGAYPIEHLSQVSPFFPAKFRWVETGVEILIFSNKDKVMNFSVEITPGYVDTNQDRIILIKTQDKNYTFTIHAKSMLSVPKLHLRKGLNRVLVESPDKVTRLKRHSFIRRGISLDPRLTNFAISYAGVSKI